MINKGSLIGLVDDVNEVFENLGTKRPENYLTDKKEIEEDRNIIRKENIESLRVILENVKKLVN